MFFELSVMRERFPNAWGALPKTNGQLPSEADILAISAASIRDANLRSFGWMTSTSWLENESVRNTLFFAAFMQGDEKRKRENALALSHQDLVAHHTVNDPDLLKLDLNVDRIAVPAIGHDTEEASDKRKHKFGDANLFIAQYCFVGSPSDRAAVLKDLKDLTDETGVKSRALRLAEQERRIRDNDPLTAMTAVARKIRLHDKMHHNESDTRQIEKGHVPEEQIRNSLQQSREKYAILRALEDRGELPTVLKQRYLHNMLIMERHLKKPPGNDGTPPRSMGSLPQVSHVDSPPMNG